MDGLNITLTGNLTNDPTQKIVGEGDKKTKLTKFTVAHNPKKEAKADYYNVEMWGDSGDAVYQFLKSGSRVMVTANRQQIVPFLQGKNRPAVSVKLTSNHVIFL